MRGLPSRSLPLYDSTPIDCLPCTGGFFDFAIRMLPSSHSERVIDSSCSGVDLGVSGFDYMAEILLSASGIHAPNLFGILLIGIFKLE